MPRPNPRPYDVEQLFALQRPKDQHLPQYEAVRAAAIVFAETILENVPPGPDQDDAIRHIRKAVMMANSSIALEGSLLKCETVFRRLLERVFHPSRTRNTVIAEVHLNPADAQNLHGHARFDRETDTSKLQRGLVGRIEGAAVVSSPSVPEGAVRVVEVERGVTLSCSDPIPLFVS